MPHFVIVGGGLAGATAASTLRAQGFSGAVTLLSEESAPPYDHVPLSKHYLRGEPGLHSLFVQSPDYYQSHDIDLRLGDRVTSLDTKSQTITLASGNTMRYDAALLATGSTPRRLTIPGSDLEGVHYLRTLPDAEMLREALHRVNSVAVIGTGWIGCEIAASARQLGKDVALIGRSELPMGGASGPLGTEITRFYLDRHTAEGVRWHMGRQVTELLGVSRAGTARADSAQDRSARGQSPQPGSAQGGSGQGRSGQGGSAQGGSAQRGSGHVSGLRLDDGTLIDAELVVVGIGGEPRIDLAVQAGLAVQGGVILNEFLQSSAPNVYAAGDIANAFHPRLGKRVQLGHFANALEQGKIAARNMLGESVSDATVPFFFSDQYNVWMEYTGDNSDSDEFVVRGEIDSGQFIAFWLANGRLQAGCNVGIKGVPDMIRDAIIAGKQLDTAALVDPGATLTDLLVGH